MKYFLDTEFIEGTQKNIGLKRKIFIIGLSFIALGIITLVFLRNGTPSIIAGALTTCIGVFYLVLSRDAESMKTIDLISIGIVAEDGREYYAVSKDFNLKEAWNRYQIKIVNASNPLKARRFSLSTTLPYYGKEYWLRDNVLFPIFKELYNRSREDAGFIKAHLYSHTSGFTYGHLKALIKWYGVSNEEIAKDIKKFVYNDYTNVLISKEGRELGTIVYYRNEDESIKKWKEENEGYTECKTFPIEFYGYYADYDWVVFCWLFGKMIDLPIGFPKYCKDLKQISDDVYNERKKSYEAGGGKNFISELSNHPDYPKQVNEHNALEDARWNESLYKFLNEVKL